MPWQETSVMQVRQEFVSVAQHAGLSIAELCRRYGISRKTGYKWLARADAGERAFTDRSRRPSTSPQMTAPAIEAAVLALRDAHPVWGGRKLHHALLHHALLQPVPAPSTITAILRRHGRVPPPERAVHAYQRFEHPAPNALWQLDFMGQPDLPLGKLHPLTVLDDHSRFALVVAACPHQREDLVQEHLTAAFRRYGLPRRILTDNGSPWGGTGAGGMTGLEAWWLQLGIAVSHGRPYHPQTQGKVERLHRTLWAEAVGTQPFRDLAEAQHRFDAWRAVYNHQRPHEALAYAVPASRYHPSPHPFPERLPPIRYGPDDAVRQVYHPGRISFRGQEYFVGHGLIGYPVAVRPTSDAGIVAVWYCQRQVATLDLTARP
jgi:transposase InsO family protein